MLVGPGGLFVISTKSRRGLFRCATPPTFNNEPCTWCNDAVRQAMRLRDQLAVLEHGNLPWIQPILALPFGHIEPGAAVGDPPTCERAWVLNEDDLVTAIEEKSPKHQRLSSADRARWVAALEKLHSRHSPTSQ